MSEHEMELPPMEEPWAGWFQQLQQANVNYRDALRIIYEAHLAALRENKEQARLLGISGSKEAALLARAEKAERESAELSKRLMFQNAARETFDEWWDKYRLQAPRGYGADYEIALYAWMGGSGQIEMQLAAKDARNAELEQVQNANYMLATQSIHKLHAVSEVLKEWTPETDVFAIELIAKLRAIVEGK